MNMKKWISIALVLAIAIGIMCFAGCRREEPTSPALSGDPTTPTAPANPVVDPEKDNSKEPPVEAPTMPEETDPQDTKPVDPEQNATQPEATEPETTVPPTEPETTEPPTEPEATQPEPTKPENTQPNPTEPAKEQLAEEFKRYEAMSGTDQRAFMESFSDITEFFDWYNAAKAAYEECNPDIEIGEGATVDISGKNAG